MRIYPAIDLNNGTCVRLTKGDFETAEQVASSPIEAALSFKEAGAEYLHMVDLDGAKTGTVQNRNIIIETAKESGLSTQVGGGIRDIATAAYYLENGIDRVILGSIAVKNPKLLAELVREYKERIIVGIDASEGIVKTEGWLDDGKVNFITLAKEMFHIGVQQIIYTDISKDGTLQGASVDDLKLLRDNVNINIIASGGIHNIDDIKQLAKMGMYGAVCGKSLYQGTLDLAEAIKVGAEVKPENNISAVKQKSNPKPNKKYNRFPNKGGNKCSPKE